MSLQKLGDVSTLIRNHLTKEVEAGFPTLGRIPSTGMIRFLDYFATLGSADRDALLDARARYGAMSFFPPVVVRDQMLNLAHTDPAVLRCREAMLSARFSMGLRYLDLRMRKAMLADAMSVQMMAQTRATLDFIPRDEMPEALVPDPDPSHLKPAKAPQLRKLIDGAFEALLASSKQKLPGGETGHTGVLDGTNLTVWIDYAARGLQLRYGISIPDETKTTYLFRFTYDDLWSGGSGWDYLTEENAEASVELLCDLVGRVVRLRNEVRGLM